MVAINRRTNGRVSKPRTAHATLASRKASRLPTLNQKKAALSEPLDLFVFGSGSMGELGLGPEAKTKEVKRPRLNPFLPLSSVGIVDFAVGGMHTLALDKENKLWSWGGNDSGVLGRDTSADSDTNLRDMDEESEDEDGDLNPQESTPRPVEGLPENLKIVSLAATDNLSAALMEDGTVFAWGTFRCNEGILGFSSSVTVQRTPKLITEFNDIVMLASGKDHILGLDSKGIVYAWGNGQQYQLGRRIMERTRMTSLEPREFGLRKIRLIGSGEFHSFAVSHDDKVYAWGLNQYGQCGITINIEDGAVVMKPTEVSELSGKNIVSITGGEHHSIALAESGEVFVFGRMDMKEIGLSKSQLPEDVVKDIRGNARAVSTATRLPGVPPCKYIACGSHHSLAISKDGVVFSWGFADTYAVGLGNTDGDVEVPTRINNTATKEHDMKLVGCGGQFSVSAGSKMKDESAVEKRDEEMEDWESSL